VKLSPTTTTESPARSAEERILIAVINLAAIDAMERPLGKHPDQTLTSNARSAMRFLLGSGLASYCSLLGLDPNYLLRSLVTSNSNSRSGKHVVSAEHRRAYRCNLNLYKEQLRLQ
jgi:tagatose-1,6-bisphosphate aldolase